MSTVRIQSYKRPAYKAQIDVISALILRDIRTRFFGHGLGYIIAIMWPLTHIAFLMTIYTILDRSTPIGESPAQFFAVALIPIISFQYISRFVMHSVAQNKQLMEFPVVSVIDVIFARIILEAACACCVSVILVFFLVLIGVKVAPQAPYDSLAVFWSNVLLGASVGALNGIIVLKLPGWAVVYMLMQIFIYGTSGVLYLPDALPSQIRDAFSWNPVFHSVEWMRQSFYYDYHSSALDKLYLFKFSLICLFLALLINKVFYGYLRR